VTEHPTHEGSREAAAFRRHLEASAPREELVREIERLRGIASDAEARRDEAERALVRQEERFEKRISEAVGAAGRR
jgi:hypothetical protein